MFECHVRILLGDFNHRITPELTRFQDVGLVHARHLAAALAGGFKCHACNAFDFGHRVAHRVKRFRGSREVAVRSRTAATRRPEVDIAREFAHDHQVKTGDHFFAKGRSRRQFLEALGRTKVRKKPQGLAQSQNRLFRTQMAFEMIVLEVAHGAKQNRVGLLGKLQRGFGKRMTVIGVGNAANIGVFHFKVATERLEYLDGLFDDFRTDPVAGKHCNFLTHFCFAVVWFLVKKVQASVC